MFKYLRDLGITKKFILWFLFIALVPLAIATEISYRYFRKTLEQEITKSLVAIAENKTAQIEAYLSEKENTAGNLSNMSAVVQAAQDFNKVFDREKPHSPFYAASVREFSPLLKYQQKASGYDDLVLINLNGDILFSVLERENGKSLYEVALHKDSNLAEVFIKTVKSRKIQISDFEYDPGTSKASSLIGAPLFDGGELIGAIVFELNNRELAKLAQNYSGLGETGEIEVLSKIGDEIKFVAPLRFDPRAAFQRKIEGSREGLPYQKALQGLKGPGVFVDYRGKETLAVWKYLPAFRLVVIVKMDTAEVFSSAQRLRDKLLFVSLVLLLAVVIAAIVVARTISSPIRKLTEVSAVISEGNFSARARINAEDEIGKLAKTFNRMTDSLVEAKAVVEQKNAEVEEQKKLLEKANHELDSFVYTASHDLRAPLRGIISFADFLEEDSRKKLDAQGRDYLNEIRDGAKRMTELIDDLLMLSRISRIQNPYEDTDIGALIASAVKRIEFDIETHKVVLDIQGPMPVIRCDGIKMKEVFLNLINNAIKFSSKNNPAAPRVEVSYAEEPDRHKFCVRDNGIGIDPKYHKDIFDIFKRLHTAEEYEGTGAGLSIVKRIIDDHGGEIWVESEPGKGAAFYFTIPKNLKSKTEKSEKNNSPNTSEPVK
ncbi:MAG TPA: ATP-binding protein [Candidatus Omnitrophota bacterium]|nr:ATP-binding protein [Candidatus Omnitrophota bacterium]